METVEGPGAGGTAMATTEADPPEGPVTPAWRKRGTWLSTAWKVFGAPQHLEDGRQGAARFAELCEGETPEVRLMCAGVEFRQWRRVPHNPRDAGWQAFVQYCAAREVAEMEVDAQLRLGVLYAFGRPRPDAAFVWIPTEVWMRLHRVRRDDLRGEGIVYYNVAVVSAEQWSAQVAVEAAVAEAQAAADRAAVQARTKKTDAGPSALPEMKLPNASFEDWLVEIPKPTTRQVAGFARNKYNRDSGEALVVARIGPRAKGRPRKPRPGIMRKE